MKNKYRLNVTAKCPLNPQVVDEYTFEIVSEDMIQVEHLFRFFNEAEPVFQEELTQRCATAFKAEVVSLGEHSGVSVRCECIP